MKSLIFKIVSVIGAIISLFILGSRSGKNKEQNKQLKQEHDELQKDIKVVKKVNNLSFSDKSSFLLSKQRNKNSK
jgi:hypothetical protein